jgi:hypothetical protein
MVGSKHSAGQERRRLAAAREGIYRDVPGWRAGALPRSRQDTYAGGVIGANATWSASRCRRGARPGGSQIASSKRPLHPGTAGWRHDAAERDFLGAGLYGLEHNMERLAEDRANAADRQRLAASRRIVPRSDPVRPIRVRPGSGAPDAPTVLARAKERGLLIFAFGPRTVRAVTHLDVTREQCERAAGILVDIAEGHAA